MVLEHVSAELGDGTGFEGKEVVDNVLRFRWQCVSVVSEIGPLGLDRESVMPKNVVRLGDHIVTNISGAFAACSIASIETLLADIRRQACSPLFHVATTNVFFRCDNYAQ